MERLFKRILTTRLRMDLRDERPMVAVYLFGMFIEAGKYNPHTGRFEEITESEYKYKL